jgi:hypothetical protein
MLRGLLELAHGAQKAPVPACSCAKGLAVGVTCLADALSGGGLGAIVNGTSSSTTNTTTSSSGAASSLTAQGPSASTADGWRTAAARAPARPHQQQRQKTATTTDAGNAKVAAAFHSVGFDCDLPAHDAHALRSIMLRNAAP